MLDPTGARVPHARVQITCGGFVRELDTDAGGAFSSGVPAGTCALLVEASGFAGLTREDLAVSAGSRLDLRLRLSLPQLHEELTVGSDPTQAGASALVLNGEALDSLSGDQRTMESELLALAGGDGQHVPSVYVDGFSNGKIPPKSTIRQVRINSNMYSSQYDSYGFGRIEVFTKPGGESLHGSLEALANDSAWNARNPYLTTVSPYYALQGSGNLSGSFDRKTSFFLSARRFNQQNTALVDAIDLTGPVRDAVAAPAVTDDDSLRLDRQLNPANTFTLRYEFTRDALINAGVGQLVLASEGLNTTTTTQTLQAGNTQIVSPKLVSETRFQYIRTRLDQSAASTAPTIIVQGSLNGGGSPAGTLTDHQDRYEFQEYLSFDEGSHFLRFGGRYRLVRDANQSLANYNGEFIFNNLAGYQANQPSQYFVTRGQSAAHILTGDVGLFAEDEWKARSNLTFTAGLRFESQSAIPDHADWAPRIAFDWSVPSRGKKPLAVISGGFGLFYTLLDPQSLLTSVRQNGVSQQTLYGTDPASALASTPTICEVSPNLRRQYDIVGGVSIQRSLGARGRISVDFSAVRGVHQFLSENINAPLPGTYDYEAPNLPGIRPLGGTGNVYQYASDGISNGRIVTVNAFVRPTARLTLSTVYYYEHAFSDAAGVSSFASNQYNLAQDYGPMTITPTHRLFAIAGVNLPWNSHLGALLNATSGTPFNITTGEDLNGDSIYNDRPAFATDMTRASVLHTAYGAYDVDPVSGQRIIPFNAVHGPAFVTLQLDVSKTIPVGPRPLLQAAAGDKPGPPRKGERPWELRLSVETDNALNHTNPGVPVGVLSSALFGKSISLAPGLSSNQAANRMLWLRGAFNF